MNKTKTIDINPALFRASGGGSKTKKNKDTSLKPKQPLISPNILKNKLLKRIKQHKLRENNPNINNPTTSNINVVTSVSNNSDPSYTDEFVESLDYLQNLSKQKQMADQKQAKQRTQTELERKTVKNYNAMNNSNYQHVNIDLPEELSNIYLPIKVESTKFEPMTLVQNTDNVPYGILKNGTKPTYRVWNKTQKNLDSITTNPIVNHPSSITSEREKRLTTLKDKIRQKEQKEDMWMDKPYIHKPVVENIKMSASAPVNEIKIDTHVPGPNIIVSENEKTTVDEKTTTGRRRFIKKTKHRKYTLGKSKIKKTVSVLLKDRQTRKKIISAQKDLKRKPINEVKNYLREHNLLKTGSDAPNDILRKIFEDSVLAGEITNVNKDILLHNFLKSEDT
jgi:ribosome-binding factor A